MKRDDVIKLAESVEIKFQTVEGITGRITTSTRGSQSIEKIERLIHLATEKAVAEERANAEERVTELFCDMEKPYLPDIIRAIRARKATHEQ